MDVAVVATPVLEGLRVANVPVEDWEELPFCPVCGRAHDLIAVATIEAGEPGAALAACGACEHFFLRRRPTSDWFTRFYATAWDARGRTGTESATMDPRSADFCAKHVPPGSRVLDAGAGLGHSALGFRARGFVVVAEERSAHRAERLESLGFETHRSALEDTRLDEPVDLVHLKHVLEHVDDPAAALAAAARLTSNDGWIYVGVPNWHGEYAVQSFHFVPHLTLFSAASLTALLRRAGFEAVRIEADRELRVLARKHAVAAELPPPMERGALELRILDWIGESLGGGGRRTAMWWGSGSDVAYYDSRIVGGEVHARVASSALRLAGVPPRGAARAGRRLGGVPAGVTGLRAASFRVAGPSELPARVSYRSRLAPVWVK